MFATKFNVASSVYQISKVQLNLILKTPNTTKLNANFQSYCRQKYDKQLFSQLSSHSVESVQYATSARENSFDAKSRKASLETSSTPKPPLTTYNEKSDIFGDISDRKFEKQEEDADEMKEYEFLKNEGRRPRRLVPSPGQYAHMIKKHIRSGDMKAALGVLVQVKNDRNKPDNYMYNLIIREFAVQGKLKRCFHLYNQMKKHALKPTLATYTSLINACANSDNSSEICLEQLNSLRQMFIEQGIAINETHYKAMIKAYGRHGRISEAFQLVDEMCDKKMNVDVETFNFLLHGTISDTTAGFRHALITWHVMHRWHIRPDLYTYNLLLRAARDCKIGCLKIEDLLEFGKKGTEMDVVDSDRPNLLASPPMICTSMAVSTNGTSSDLLPEQQSNSALVPVAQHTNSDKSLSTALVENDSQSDHLLLMGGFHNFVARMKSDNVKPNIKTISLLMELVPNTEAAENIVIKYAKNNGIKLDIDFYNLLIRKRSFRYDYDGALKVMGFIQQENLMPNIMTWGVIALTCRTRDQVKELLEGMETSGHRLNVQIIGSLLRQASQRWLFSVISVLMEKMQKEQIKPNKQILGTLDDFHKKAVSLNNSKDKPEYAHKLFWKNGFRRLEAEYPNWRKKMLENTVSEYHSERK